MVVGEVKRSKPSIGADAIRDEATALPSWAEHRNPGRDSKGGATPAVLPAI